MAKILKKKGKKNKFDKIDSNFVHLHLHTSYSIGDGAVHIDELCKKVKELGMGSVAVTEHGSLSSFLKFYKAAKKEGINPILGCEFYSKDNREEQQKKAEIRKNIRENKCIECGHKLRKKDIICPGCKAPVLTEDEMSETYTYEPNQHLLVLAKSWKGFESIMKIHGDAVRNGFYYRPRTTHDKVIELGEDIVVTTACINGLAGTLIRQNELAECEKFLVKMKEAFDDDFYIELQFLELPEQHLVNEKLLEFAKKLDIKFIITNDVHYLNKEDVKAHDMHKLISRKKTVNDEDYENHLFTVRELYLKTAQEMYESAIKWEYKITKEEILQAFANTVEIAEKCKGIEVPMGVIKFPKFYPDPKNPDPNFDPYEYLVKKVNKGFKWRLKNGHIPKHKVKEYIERGRYELDVVKKMNFEDYFLITSEDITDFAHENDIFHGGGRGSAAGSIISWFLRITEVDSIKYGLIFERFLNVDRADPPDIDLDFASDTRHLIEEHLIEKYGEEKVAHVISFGTYGTKGVIRDVGRVLGVDYKIVNKIATALDDSESVQEGFNRIIEEDIDNDIIKFLKSNKEFRFYCERLYGLVRNYSKHAGGTVITPGPLENYIPIMKVGGQIITGLQEGGDEREMTDMGILKFDILGLNWCRILKKTIDLVKERHGIDYTNKIWNIDYNDPNLMAEFAKGNTTDIFQFGSAGMRELIQKTAGTLNDKKLAKPENVVLLFKDLIAINAGYRPAIIMSGNTERFAKNKHLEDDEIEYVHDAVKPILQETYGAMLYQEHLLKILNEVAGFTMAEADKARKTLKLLFKGKKDHSDFDKMLAKFEKGCKENGLSDEVINELLEMLKGMADYSFNKSHSCSYAQGAVQGMFFKVYYTIEYLTALLNCTENMDKKKFGKKVKNPMEDFIKMARSMGYRVLPPDINKSSGEFLIEDDKSIRAPLSLVKGVGEKAGFEVAKYQPFDSFDDFLKSKIDWRKVNKGHIEKLIKVGAFDSLLQETESRFILLKAYIQWRDADGKNKKLSVNDFINIEDMQQNLYNTKNLESFDFTEEEKLQFELELIGFYFSMHPLDKYLNFIENNGWLLPHEVKKKHNKIIIAGYIQNVKTIRTKYEEKMAFVDLIDTNDGSVSVTIWPEQYAKYKNKLKPGKCVAIKVKKNKTNNPKYKDSFIIRNSDEGKMLVADLEKIMEKEAK